LAAPLIQDTSGIFIALSSPSISSQHLKQAEKRIWEREKLMEMAYEEAISMREELRRSSGDPIFVKPMMQSNVIGGFWLVNECSHCSPSLTPTTLAGC
jgi:hypothetical protein